MTLNRRFPNELFIDLALMMCIPISRRKVEFDAKRYVQVTAFCDRKDAEPARHWYMRVSGIAQRAGYNEKSPLTGSVFQVPANR